MVVFQDVQADCEADVCGGGHVEVVQPGVGQ